MQVVQELLDLGVRGLVLDPAKWLVGGKIGDHSADEAFYGRELTLFGRDGKFELGEDDGARGGFDDLAAEVFTL